MKNLPIKYKILLVLCVVLLIKFPFDIFMSQYFINFASESEATTLSAYEYVEMLLEMKNTATKIQSLTSNLANKIKTNSYEENSYEDDKNELLSTVAEFEKWQNKYFKLKNTQNNTILDKEKLEKMKNSIVISALNVFDSHSNINNGHKNPEKLNELSKYINSLSEFIDKALHVGANNIKMKKIQIHSEIEYLVRLVLIIDATLLVIALIISFFVAQLISVPIMQLTKYAKDVTKTITPTKLPKFPGDEVTQLTFSIKTLFAETTKANKNLKNINNNLKKEIIERKKVELKNAALNKKLITTARFAGMADVAASILHNIGNIINSVNISISMISEKLTHSETKNLESVANMLEQNKSNLESFLVSDPRGQHVPYFLLKLSEALSDEKNYVMDEVNKLNNFIQHINEIIEKQNLLSHYASITEVIEAPQLIEEVLMLNENLYKREEIEIIRDFKPTKKITIDRIKLMQILANLIKNSIDALSKDKIKDKQILIRIQEKDNSHIVIQVRDNGIGISPENLKKIFSPGFTTKQNGHGFGLHSSANAAHEIGGNLSAESSGLEKGATFTLVLPYKMGKQKGSTSLKKKHL